MAVSLPFSIILPNGSQYDILLSLPPASTGQYLPQKTTLRFLSVVDISRVPLHFIVGPQYDVTTASIDTERWFSEHLLASPSLSPDSSLPWWQSARPESPLGILVGVETNEAEERNEIPSVTELLFYAATTKVAILKPPTPPTSSPGRESDPLTPSHPHNPSVHALCLSSHLASAVDQFTPPASPGTNDEEFAVFLPNLIPTATETINEPPTRKRRNVNDTFDEAAERRKKARRKGGQSVAAAAATKSEVNLPNLKHRRTVSGLGTQAAPLQTRPLSRSPSIVSSRPNTARAPSEPQRRSTLSRVQSVCADTELDAVELKNKDLISRIVMAGMRLHGLWQSKARKSRAHLDINGDPADAEYGARDEEFKLVYHQAYKGTCFAVRQHMRRTSLSSYTEVLQDIVDKLLAMFCNDPLSCGLPSPADKLTPGGRKAFASPQVDVPDPFGFSS